MYLNEPWAYDDYMAHLEELTAKRDEEKLALLHYKRSPSQRIDFVDRNKTDARALQKLQEQKHKQQKMHNETMREFAKRKK